MIEIFFSDSAAGEFKYSQLYDGDSTDICSFPILLDFGKIKEGIFSAYRKNLYTEMFWEAYPALKESQDRMDDYFDGYAMQLQKLKEFLEQGKPIRIWVDRNPASQCAYHYICNILTEYIGKTEVFVVEMPLYLELGERMVSYHSWGCMDSSELNNMLIHQRKLSDKEIMMMSMHWKKLVEEDSGLRAVINGKLVSVGANFYDDMILQYIGDKEMTEKEITGGFLEDSDFGLNYMLVVWIVKRLIQNGKIVEKRKETKTSEAFYGAI